jgi:hypothetical protein
MKTNLLKYCVAAFYFCSTFMMVAQPGAGSDNGGVDGDGTGDVTPGAPIDDYVWVLALIGLCYVFLRLRAFTRQGKIASGE